MVNNKKKRIIFISIIIGIIIILFVLIFKLFFVDSNKDVYGNRLDGINKVKIGENQISDIKEQINSYDEVNSVEYDLKGRLINIIIELKDKTDLNNSKSFINKCLEVLDEEQKQYYDIQVFLISENEKQENYPAIGYKNKNSNDFAW